MLSFIEFFYISEVVASSEPVRLQNRGDVLLYTFKSPNKSGEMETYEVTMQPIPGSHMATDLANDLRVRGYDSLSKIKSVKGYNILFKTELDSEKAYMPTGKSANPTHVITEVISAVKTLINQEKPKVLQFYGSTTEQKSVYHKLYISFLRPAGYQLVENSLGMDYYVHTDLLQSILGPKFDSEMSRFSAIDIERRKQLKMQKKEKSDVKPQVRKGLFPW